MRSKDMKIGDKSIQKTTLSPIGLSRWEEIKGLIPFSRERYRQLANAGKAPKGIQMGTRLTCYKNAEILEFLNDPLNYQSK